MSDNIRVSLSVTLDWEYEHVLPLNLSEKRYGLNSQITVTASQLQRKSVVSQTIVDLVTKVNQKEEVLHIVRHIVCDLTDI